MANVLEHTDKSKETAGGEGMEIDLIKRAAPSGLQPPGATFGRCYSIPTRALIYCNRSKDAGCSLRDWLSSPRKSSNRE